MIINLLIFRLKQVYRFAREIGRIRFGILLFLAIYILLTFKKAAESPFGAGSVSFITALSALSFRLGPARQTVFTNSSNLETENCIFPNLSFSAARFWLCSRRLLGRLSCRDFCCFSAFSLFCPMPGRPALPELRFCLVCCRHVFSNKMPGFEPKGFFCCRFTVESGIFMTKY